MRVFVKLIETLVFVPLTIILLAVAVACGVWFTLFYKRRTARRADSARAHQASTNDPAKPA